jgi:hypothetical protein
MWSITEIFVNSHCKMFSFHLYFWYVDIFQHMSFCLLLFSQSYRVYCHLLYTSYFMLILYNICLLNWMFSHISHSIKLQLVTKFLFYFVLFLFDPHSIFNYNYDKVHITKNLPSYHLLSVQLNSVSCIHMVLQPISGTFLSCKI